MLLTGARNQVGSMESRARAGADAVRSNDLVNRPGHAEASSHNEPKEETMSGQSYRGVKPACLRTSGVLRVVTLMMLLLLATTGVHLATELPVVETVGADNLDDVLNATLQGDAIVEGQWVALFNGNLALASPAGGRLPLDAGATMSFAPFYNSKNARLEKVRFPDVDGQPVYKDLLYGRSWLGLGWTGHLGRILPRSRYERFDADGNGTLESWRYVFSGKEFIELPSGNLVRFFPNVNAARPNLRIEFFVDCTNYEPPIPPACCFTSPPKCDPESPRCDPIDSCDSREGDPAHYLVTWPDGTQFRFEQLVPSQTSDGWVRNSDRAGWYVVNVQDVHANAYRVRYWQRSCVEDDHLDSAFCQQEYPFPEAIRDIRSARDPGRVIEVDVWRSSDAGTPGYHPNARGMLKEVRATGFQGSIVRWRFGHDVVPISDGIDGPLSVPVLTRAALLDESGSEIAHTEYRYGQSAAARFPALLDRVLDPLGALTEFEYDVWLAGKRPGDPPGSGDRDRFSAGVTRATVWPDGNSHPSLSHLSWQWQRAQEPSRLPGCDATDPSYLQGFRRIGPGGGVSEASYFGHFCGLDDRDWGPFGSMRTLTTFDADGTTPLRTETFGYDYQRDPATNEILRAIREVRTLTYEDETLVCFDSSEPSPRSATTTRSLRDPWHRWKASSISGHHLRSTRRDYIAWEDPQPSTCRYDDHVLTAWGWKTTEEGTERVEEHGDFDCDGQIIRLTTAHRKLAGGGAWPPSGPSYDARDIVEHYDYDYAGNLRSIRLSGSDSYPDGSAATTFESGFHSSYGVEDRVVHRDGTTGQDFPWKVVDRTIDPSGNVAASRDPNGLETRYGYDAAGRLTRIDPPGDMELPTRITYPDPRRVRQIVSLGDDTEHQPLNPQQVYRERTVDPLGRLFEERRNLPDGKLAVKLSRYDEAGRVVFVSPWIDSDELAAAPKTVWRGRDRDGDGTGGDWWIDDVPLRDGRPWGTVLFYGEPSTSEPDNPLQVTPDGLGRVRRVVQADGSTLTHRYCGPHAETTASGVQTAIHGPATGTAVVRNYHDDLGRLVLVDSPTGTADAVYDYDVRGKVKSVNLVAQLPPDPFQAWRNGSLPTGQLRTFEYDGAGRLLRQTTPEEGTKEFGSTVPRGSAAYDSAGHLLAWQDAQALARDYFYKNSFDGAGRLTKVERVQGSPSHPETSGTDRLGETAGFELGRAGWEWGTLDETTGRFSPGLSYWRTVNYADLSCAAPPPDSSGATNAIALYFGDGCRYTRAPSGPQAVRRAVGGVTRKDVLSFSYWRQVREAASELDKFSVYVNLRGTDSYDMRGRRTAFRLDARQSSFAVWERSVEIRPADLFDVSEWPEGETRTLYLSFVFEKKDTADPGLGAGLLVDNVFFGTRAKETLVLQKYDEKHCDAGTMLAESCTGSSSSVDLSNSQMTSLEAFDGSRLVSRRRLAYRGLNGRLSGDEQWVDWTLSARSDVAGDWNRWVTRYSHDEAGRIRTITAPFQPGVDAERAYTYHYGNGEFDGIHDENTAQTFVPPGGLGIRYGASGRPVAVRFSNGTSTEIEYDAMDRPATLRVVGPAAPGFEDGVLWSSGALRYDGLGNIAEIGLERFAYLPGGPLAAAHVLPRASDPQRTGAPEELSFGYDHLGNVLYQHRDAGLGDPPADLAFDATYNAKNQRADAGFAYDANGFVIRARGMNDENVALLWNGAEKLAVLFAGGVSSPQSRPAENYLYNALGLRIVRRPMGRDGRPVITLRGLDEVALSQFVVEPGSNRPRFDRDFIHGAGQVLLERQTAPPSSIQSASPMQTGGFGFEVSNSSESGSFTLDVASVDGRRYIVGGVQMNSDGLIHLPEGVLEPGTTHFVRVRPDDDRRTGYSAPAAVVVARSLSPDSANQVRAVAAIRNGSDLVVRWSLGRENGKAFRVYFRSVGSGELIPLSQIALSPTTRSLVLHNQSASLPCGSVLVTQSTAPNRGGFSSGGATESPSVDLDLAGGQDCSPPPATSPYVEHYHHRDHTGTLRVITGSSGERIDGLDFYPFGLEMSVQSDPVTQDSARKYTGHERDETSGMDSMMYRYKAIRDTAFATPDLVDDVSMRAPYTWNKYAYVRGRPNMLTDPMGLMSNATDFSAACAHIGGFWIDGVCEIYAGSSSKGAYEVIVTAPPINTAGWEEFQRWSESKREAEPYGEGYNDVDGGGGGGGGPYDKNIGRSYNICYWIFCGAETVDSNENVHISAYIGISLPTFSVAVYDNYGKSPADLDGLSVSTGFALPHLVALGENFFRYFGKNWSLGSSGGTTFEKGLGSPQAGAYLGFTFTDPGASKAHKALYHN